MDKIISISYIIIIICKISQLYANSIKKCKQIFFEGVIEISRQIDILR